MRIWCKVYNASYTDVVQTGQIFARAASVKRSLDGKGSGRVSIPWGDPVQTARVLDAFRAKRICEIWRENHHSRNGVTQIRMGAFVIQGDTFSLNGNTRSMSFSGPDTMQALKDRITLPGLIYNAQTVANVVSNLAGLAGWTVDTTGVTGTISIRMDGDSVLKGLQVIAETQGLHFRLASGTKALRFGALGEDNGLIAVAKRMHGGRLHENANLLLIDRLEHVKTSDDLCNWALPIGGGAGDAAVTLADSTRSFVETYSENGRTHYIIKDDASIAEYGQIMKRLDVSRVTPVANNDQAIQDAANLIADSAKAHLDRYKEPQEVLRMTCRNVHSVINPGDKVHVEYNGDVFRDGELMTSREIAGDYWVVDVNEESGEGGETVSLTVSNIDRYPESAAKVVVDAVDSVRVENIGVKPKFNRDTRGPYIRSLNVDNFNQWTIKLPITEYTQQIKTVIMIVNTVPSVISASQVAGGDHRHTVMRLDSSPPVGTLTTRRFTIYDDNTASTFAFLAGTTATPPRTFETTDAGTHTHPLVFTPTENTGNYCNIDSITVNGVTVTSGSLGSSVAGVTNERIDITNAILGKSGGVRQVHDVVITTAIGTGDVIVEFEVYDTIAEVNV